MKMSTSYVLSVAATVFSFIAISLNQCSSQETPNGYIYPQSAQPGTKSLYFGLMMSFGGSQKSSGAIPGVQVALDIINNKSRSDILSNYTLHYILYDSQCNRTNALDGLFSFITGPQSSKNYLALMGSGCSLATQPTAEIIHYYSKPQISCVSSADELSDRIRFRNYYQLLPSEGDIAPMFLSIIQQYKWRRVAFIVQNEPVFVAIPLRVRRLLQRSRRSLETNQKMFETEDILLEGLGKNPFEQGYRIFILAMSSKPARQIICKAYLLNMTYPKYIFLTYGTYESHWWVPPDDEDIHHECTPAGRAQVLQRSLAAKHFEFLNQNDANYLTQKTNTTITRKEFLRYYQEKLERPPFYFTSDEYSQYCYDATWTLALAINKTLSVENGSGAIESGAISHLNSTVFNGISGNVNFASNGIRTLNSPKIIQYRLDPGVMNSLLEDQLQVIDIATVRCSGDREVCSFSYLNGESNSTVWPDKFGVPYDGVPEMKLVTIHTALSVIFVTLSIIGIAFTIVCLIVNFVFREKTVIRLTSPNLNYLIGFGVICVYIGIIIVLVSPTTNLFVAGRLCISNMIFISIGYTTAFGSILVKLGRVYLIFRYSHKKIVIKDWYLIVLVLGINSVNSVVLLVYVIYEGVKTGYNVTIDPSTERLSSIDGPLARETRYFHFSCSTQKTARIVVVGLTLGYILLLEIVALWFAFQIRKVKVTGLNDAKYIAVIVYVSSIVAVIAAVCLFLIRDYINIFPLVYGSCLHIGISVLLCLVFIPKMILLYKNPTGEGIFSAHEVTIAGNVFGTQVGATESEEVNELKRKITELEKAVIKLKRKNCKDSVIETETTHGKEE